MSLYTNNAGVLKKKKKSKIKCLVCGSIRNGWLILRWMVRWIAGKLSTLSMNRDHGSGFYVKYPVFRIMVIQSVFATTENKFEDINTFLS